MLNRIGHCINYNRVEELETEPTYSCSNAKQITPAGMSKKKDLFHEVSIDNYDRFTDAYRDLE